MWFFPCMIVRAVSIDVMIAMMLNWDFYLLSKCMNDSISCHNSYIFINNNNNKQLYLPKAECLCYGFGSSRPNFVRVCIQPNVKAVGWTLDSNGQGGLDWKFGMTIVSCDRKLGLFRESRGPLIKIFYLFYFSPLIKNEPMFTCLATSVFFVIMKLKKRNF